MSLLSSIFDTGAYTVTRTASAATVDDAGHTIPPATTTIPGVIGSVQPVSGRDLRDLKEGQRADDLRWFFTETPLYTTDQNHEHQDFVDIPDEVSPSVIYRYRVTNVAWFGVISGHYRAKLEKTSTP